MVLEHKSNTKVIDHSQNSNYFHQNLITVYKKKHITETLESLHQSKINNNMKGQGRYWNNFTQRIMHSGFIMTAFSNTSMHS